MTAILSEEGEHVDSQTAAHVLVVDDDPAIRELLAELLEMEGYAVQSAPDGQVALNLLTCQLPRLMVMDLRMPVMDGWTLLGQVRERGLTVPIIVLTSETGVAERLKGLPNVVYLAKPFFIPDLLELVEGFHVPRQTEPDIRQKAPPERLPRRRAAKPSTKRRSAK